MSRVPASGLWAVRDTRNLSAYAKLAYYTLFTRQPDVRPSIATLAADMSVSESTARRAVQELQRVGAVSVSERLTGEGDRDSNAYVLLPVEVVSDGHHGPVTGTPPVVSAGHPKESTTARKQGKGENSRGSRRARPALTRADQVNLVRIAVAEIYGMDEEEELSDGKCEGLWDLLIQDRIPGDPVAYLGKIFTETPDINTHLANCPPDDDPWGAAA